MKSPTVVNQKQSQAPPGAEARLMSRFPKFGFLLTLDKTPVF
jgi:hypothetical protein